MLITLFEKQQGEKYVKAKKIPEQVRDLKIQNDSYFLLYHLMSIAPSVSPPPNAVRRT